MPKHKRIENLDLKLNVSRLMWFLKISGVSPAFLFRVVALSVGYALCVLYLLRLLFPLIRGVVSNDFSGMDRMVGTGQVIAQFPEFFKDPSKLFVFLVSWFYLATLVKNGIYYLLLKVSQVPIKRATAQVRKMLVDKCLSFGKDFYDKNTIVFLQSTLTRSTGLLEAQFHLFQKFLTNGIIVVLFLGVMFVISWFMALIALVMLMTAVFLMQGFTRRLREAATAHHRASEDFGDKVFNMLYCMPVIRSFVKEDAAREEFSKMSSIELEQAARIQKLQGLSEPVEDLVSTTAVLFIAFGLAIVMRGGAPVPATHAIIFFYLVMQLKSRLKVFTSFQMAVTAAASALVDIEHILEHDPGHIVPSGSEPFQGLRENLEFRGLSFSYEPDGAKVLDQLSFSVPARSIVAIVGPSGSGKSTLINLLMRFYDCAPGMIFVDGRDIRDYDVTSFRKRLAFVGQDVLLFNDTIHNNMVYGLEEEVSEEHLREVSRGTMLMEFIRKMPKKWQTSVGDRGGRLSGGEKQRLSIARAVIKTSDILIMDEATSALDARTEARISRYVFQAAQQKTVIIIAHRLATVRNADKIVYIEKGRVVEEGSFQELVARKGAFFEQWQLQRI